MKTPSLSLVPGFGWQRNLRLGNGEVELVVTLEVGPRIIAYRRVGEPGLFKHYPDQLGRSGEDIWRNRGGHRLWLAPERRPFTYFPDNAPVAWTQVDDRTVRFTPPAEAVNGLQKELEVTLAEQGTDVTVVHRVTRTAGEAETLALWGLTVMAPGGEAIVPQPPPGEHPRDLLPNRRLIVWPYTNLADPRWHWDERFATVRQAADAPPFKVGLAHRGGWAGYRLRDQLFVKTVDWRGEAAYADDGCNLEIFTNGLMLELESLGPLVPLAVGETLEHVEQWSLLRVPADEAGWREWKARTPHLLPAGP